MSVVLKFSLKQVFYITFISVIFLFIQYLLKGNEFEIAPVGSTIFVLFIIAFFSINAHLEALHDLGVKDITEQSISPFQEKIIQSQLSQAEMVELIKERGLNENLSLKYVSDGIHLNYRDHWYHQYSRISIVPLSTESDQKTYKISSKPKYAFKIPFTESYLPYVDYGRNYKNVWKFESLLTGKNDYYLD